MPIKIRNLSSTILTFFHVRFTPNSGHVRCKEGCPLCANSGHVLRKQKDRRGAVWLRISDFVENRLAVSARRYRGIVILPSGRRFIGYIVLLVLFGLLRQTQI
jgi:hypothetical protein